MELFIESPQRRAERIQREQQLTDAHGNEQRKHFDLDEPSGFDSASGIAANASMAVSADDARNASRSKNVRKSDVPAVNAYRAELAYDRKRARRRKLGAVVKIMALVVLVPVAAVLVFIAAYALTYILNGASPEQVAMAMTGLFERIISCVQEVINGNAV